MNLHKCMQPSEKFCLRICTNSLWRSFGKILRVITDILWHLRWNLRLLMSSTCDKWTYKSISIVFLRSWILIIYPGNEIKKCMKNVVDQSDFRIAQIHRYILNESFVLILIRKKDYIVRIKLTLNFTNFLIRERYEKACIVTK